MLALISLAAASLADEHTAFEGVVQFDALQTPSAPGAPVATPVASPNTPPSGSTISTCLRNCQNAGVQTNLKNGISTNAGGLGTNNIAVACAAACTPGSGRSLLQTADGNTATITITNASPTQLQTLQSNILAGNLVQYGIAPSDTLVVAPSSTPPLAPVPVPLAPSNPASSVAQAICANAANPRIGACLIGAAGPPVETALGSCSNALATLLVANANLAAVCCPCTRTGRQAGFQVVLDCVNFPRQAGCGKRGSKKGLLGLLGLLGLIPLLLCLLICCLCCIRRKRRGQAMLFSQTAVPAPIPAPLPLVPEPHLHAGPDFHVHP